MAALYARLRAPASGGRSDRTRQILFLITPNKHNHSSLINCVFGSNLLLMIDELLSPSSSKTGTCMRALVVDDNEIFRALFAQLLDAAGWVATCTTDGNAALAILDEAAPDVIFTDIHMSGMDGFALLAALRALGPPQPPIVAVTSDWAEDALSNYLAVGFDWAIEKPLKTEQLLGVLAALHPSPNVSAA
ncbi:MAG: response regulator [Caulobacterales bacterium]